MFWLGKASTLPGFTYGTYLRTLPGNRTTESGMDIKEWMYTCAPNAASGSGATQQTRGPVPASILIKLMEKGVVDNSTFVWRPGMAEWVALTTIEPFKEVATFQCALWHYIDGSNQQQGPASTAVLLKKIKENEINGLTLVYSSGICTEWVPLHEQKLLKDAFMSIKAEQEAYENILGLSDPNNLQDSAPPPKAIVTKEKRFTTDDGAQLYWDEDEGDWVVDENPSDNGDTEQKIDVNECSDEEVDDHNKAASHSDDKANTNSNLAKETNKKRKKKAKKGNWVYISGLPMDITFDEVKDHFSKVGLISISPFDQQPQIKLYHDDHGQLKGDCSLCYNAKESVDMAVNILSGGYIRPSKQITVIKADFTRSLNTEKVQKRPRGNINEKQIKTAYRVMKQALMWNEDDDSGVSKSTALKIIVLEGAFSLEELHKIPKYDETIEKNIAEACSKHGEIDKITLYSKNPKGIVIVKYKTSYAAQECVRVLNNSNFCGKMLKVYFWDGTDYSIVRPSAHSTSSRTDDELDEGEEAKRLKEFGSWLENAVEDELPEELRLQTE